MTFRRYGIGDVITEDEDLYAIVYNGKGEEVERPDVYWVENSDEAGNYVKGQASYQ